MEMTQNQMMIIFPTILCCILMLPYIVNLIHAKLAFELDEATIKAHKQLENLFAASGFLLLYSLVYVTIDVLW